jgi:hypothetical protein
MKASKIVGLISLAKKATGQGEGKWDANTALISWFRSDPVAILEALHAAAHVSERPGGLAHTRLHEALGKLPEHKKESK